MRKSKDCSAASSAPIAQTSPATRKIKRRGRPKPQRRSEGNNPNGATSAQSDSVNDSYLEVNREEPNQFPEDAGIDKRYSGTLVTWAPIISSAPWSRGYIECELQAGSPQLVFVSTLSQRDRHATLSPGDLLNFKLERTLRGLAASDVVRLTDEIDGAAENSAFEIGTLQRVNKQQQFGIVEFSDGRAARLNFSDLLSGQPENGATVRFEVETIIGDGTEILHARRASILCSDNANKRERQRSAACSVQDLYAEAMLARNKGDYDFAARLFDAALQKAPSDLQTIISYAAMERNRRNIGRATALFDHGLKRFPENPRLHQDFGSMLVAEGSLAEGIAHLETTLNLSLRGSGNKTLFLSLARAYHKQASQGDPEAVQKVCEYYAEAERLANGNGLSPSDSQAFHSARTTFDHGTAAKAVYFFKRAGFQVSHVMEGTETCQDLVLVTDEKELPERYGVSSAIFVRALSNEKITLADLADLEQMVNACRAGFGHQEVLAFLVAEGIDESSEDAINRRILAQRSYVQPIVVLDASLLALALHPREELRRILDQYLFRRDLFAANAPVHGSQFFGRTHLLGKITDCALTGQSVGLFGLRKVGKTSLLQELKRRFAAAGDVALYLDLLSLPGGADTGWVYWTIARQLRSATNHLNLDIAWRLAEGFKSYLDIPTDFQIPLAFDSDIQALLESVAERNFNPRPKIVLMIDEVERLLPIRHGESGCKGFADLLGYFRGLSQKTQDFVMIVAAANPFIQETAQFSGRDNPLFNYFHEGFIRMLEPKECEAMIASLGSGMGVHFERAACDRIYQLTAGHPFITRAFCSFMAEERLERPTAICESDVDSCVTRYLELKGDKDFNEIIQRLQRDYPDELKVCVELARTELVSGSPRLDGESIRHLLGYDLITRTGDSVRLSMDLMRIWLTTKYGQCNT